MVNTQKERYLVSEFLKNPVSWLETEILYHSYTTRGEAQEVANGIDRMISDTSWPEQVVSSTKAFKCAIGYSVLVLTLGGYRTYGNQCETSRRIAWGEPDKDKISRYARSFRTFRDAEKPH
jgi:hypothetical protein